jgi:hypothetical protein
MDEDLTATTTSAPAAQPGPSGFYLPWERGRAKQFLSDSARNMGIACLAGRGAGKSTLMSLIALQDALRNIPVLLCDPVGSTLEQLIWLVMRLPPQQQAWFWKKTIYVDAAGRGGHIVPCPLYYRLGEESLYEIAQRPLDLIRKLDSNLQEAPVLGWNSVYRIGTMAGLVLAALGYQITEVEDLLDAPDLWEDRFHAALERHPEIAPAVAFFRRNIDRRDDLRTNRTETFRTKTAFLSLDPTMRATFGAATPGIDWRQATDRSMVILIDFSGVHDVERKRFLMWWWLSYFKSFILARGQGRWRPWSVILDELTAYLNFQARSDALVQELDHLINVVSRSHQLWLTAGLQEPWQVDRRIAQGLLTFGTLILGRTSDADSAEWLARHLFRYDPTRVRKTEPVYMSDRGSGPYVVDETTVEFSPDEQTLLNSYKLRDETPALTFWVRPALTEGTVGRSLRKVSIRRFIDAQFWPDKALVDDAKAQLCARSGLAVASVLQEVEERLQLPVVLAPPTSPDQQAPPAQGGKRDRRNKPTPAQQQSPEAIPFWQEDE